MKETHTTRVKKPPAARKEIDMEWRIRESARGFYAERGGYVQPGTEVGFAPGYFMPGFIVSESARFDTKEEAAEYIERRERK